MQVELLEQNKQTTVIQLFD